MRPKQLQNILLQAYPDARGEFPEYKINCLFCSDTRYRLGINVVKQVGHCFNCGRTLSTRAVVALLRDTKVMYEENSFESLEDALTGNDAVVELEVAPEELAVRAVPMLSVHNGEHPELLQIYELAMHYVYSRGFDESVAFDYGFMVPYYDSPLRNRLVLPIFENGKLMSYQARALLKNSRPKYVNPKKSSGGCSKSNLVYNLDCAGKCENIIICEGIFSAISVGKSAVAIFGKDLSTAQAGKIIQSGVKHATIMLDPDAIEWAVKAAAELHPRVSVTIAKLENGDPNEVSVEEIEQCLRSASPYDDFVSVA